MKMIAIGFSVLLLLLPEFASAGWDMFTASTVEIATSNSEYLTLVVLPDGTGAPFTSCQSPLTSSLVDGTITLYLRDDAGVPVAGFPSEDIWLASADGGMAMCVGGTTADASTGSDGATTWTVPLRAGGSSQAGSLIVVNGLPLNHLPPLPFHFNSPDINGDLQVNLSDIPLFVSDLQGAYNFRSDFHRDGLINLSDVIVMAGFIGRSCP